MLRLEMKNYNKILKEKQQKYQQHHQVKLYLTAENIVLTDQSRMREQANFPYFPLSKLFEKLLKTNKNEGEKQVKAFAEHGKQLVESCDKKDSSTLLKQKEIFEEIANERMGEIQNLTN